MSEAVGDQQHEVHSNALGGESLYLSPGADLQTVPSSFLKLLTVHHAAIYRYPREYFNWLARRARLSGMKAWLSTMAAADRCGLYLHRAEMGRTLQTDVTVRGFLAGPRGFSDFRLSSSMPLFELPTPLQDVYELIDGTVEGNAFEAGGFERFSSLRFDASSFAIVNSHLVPDLGRTLCFYSTGNGDHLIAANDKAFWFLHENSSLVEAGNLAEVVDSYFMSLLSGSTWLRDPYGSLR
ncbi:hypothetical protein [Candidatus Laterigemmans baculatus]|uniref:hypothetical protein n=1 Tax=Candidatus Laterigemmans baculatus TaxID=2770505 RepID=UPI0013DA6471|nr:hypothetical protein [Candidatus Laterigemmans baculatus]